MTTYMAKVGNSSENFLAMGNLFCLNAVLPWSGLFSTPLKVVRPVRVLALGRQSVER
jgi:hypothetical protein